MASPQPTVELVAPAGNPDCLRAALAGGADAVYFGLDDFNARARADNFSCDALPEVVARLHHAGAKAYVALNTLIFPCELPRLEQFLRRVAESGTDAVIVQDLGVLRLARAICPELPVHASTQMSLSSAEGIRAVESLGISRVVLARELSLAEIRQIRGQTGIELEVFVHGALCISYSGQCAASLSIGPRSANRGHCAQVCRTAFEVVCDGRTLDLGPRTYILLSPQDLAAYDLVPELIGAGVRALKIEGRMKSPEYVAVVTRFYRETIDAALAGRPAPSTAEQVREMEVCFSRGFSHGWLEGDNPQVLVSGLDSAKRGVLAGEVRSVGKNRVRVRLTAPIKRGDGVVFASGAGGAPEQGGRVYEVFRDGQSVAEPVASGVVALAFGRGAIDFQQLRPGQQLWKTDDPALQQAVRKTCRRPGADCRVPLTLRIEAAVGSPLRVTATAASGVQCQVHSAQPLAQALKHPLTSEQLAEQFGRLGGTSYRLDHLEAQITGAPMVPLSVLGKLRHELVAQLDAAEPPPGRPVAEGSALARLRATLPVQIADAGASPGRQPEPELHVLCRSQAQLQAALDCGVGRLVADFHDLDGYDDAVRQSRAAGAEILLATPRIHKPGENRILDALLRREPDGLLVRNLAGLAYCGQHQVAAVADFSLNAANDLSAQWLLQQGAQRVTVSYDLPRDAIGEMVAALRPESLEVVVYQHVPMFHTQHCLFCNVLGSGTNRADCGQPCERRSIRLRDRMGVEHLLESDAACRNTVFNGRPQSLAEVVSLLRIRGVRHFRIEFPPDAGADDAARLIGLHRNLLAGRSTGSHVWAALQASERYGVTRGTWETP